MEQQLKSLKVVDLKAILAKASVQVSSKANKIDLIARILSSQPAIDVYKSIYASDELLAPPEDVDWSHEQESRTASLVQPPIATPAPISAPTNKPASTEGKSGKDATPIIQPTSATNSASNAKSTAEDEETEKRRRRAERFGIPFIENPTSQPTRITAPAASDDVAKLEARAARFGIASSNAQKREEAAGSIDAGEEEKRRKRAERFGSAPHA